MSDSAHYYSSLSLIQNHSHPPERPHPPPLDDIDNDNGNSDDDDDQGFGLVSSRAGLMAPASSLPDITARGPTLTESTSTSSPQISAPTVTLSTPVLPSDSSSSAPPVPPLRPTETAAVTMPVSTASDLPALPGKPPAAYISAAAAAAFLTDRAMAKAASGMSSNPASIPQNSSFGLPNLTGTHPALASLSDSISPGFSLEAVALINSFLDHILLAILAAASSPSLTHLRLAVHTVLKARLAAAATAIADEEVRGLVDSEEEDDDDNEKEEEEEREDGGDDDENDNDDGVGDETLPLGGSDRENRMSGDDLSAPPFHARSKSRFSTDHPIFAGLTVSRHWLLQARFRRLRLRIMVYAQLGDVEELDEQQYLADPATDDTLLIALGLSDGLAAIFLAAVLEHIAEHALLAVHATAVARSRAANSTSVFVEEKDVQKLSLNGTLGRLFRSFRRLGKDITSGTAMSMLSMSGKSVASVRSLSAMSGGMSSCGSVDDSFPVPPTSTVREPGGPGLGLTDESLSRTIAPRNPVEGRTSLPLPLKLRTDLVSQHSMTVDIASAPAVTTHRPLIPLILPTRDVLDSADSQKQQQQHSRSSSLPLRRIPDRHPWAVPVSPRSPAFGYSRDKSGDGRFSAGARIPVPVSVSASNSTSRLVLDESPPLSGVSDSPSTRPLENQPGLAHGESAIAEDGDLSSGSEAEVINVADCVSMPIRRVSLDREAVGGADSDQSDGVQNTTIQLPESSPSYSHATHPIQTPASNGDLSEDDFTLSIPPPSGSVELPRSHDQVSSVSAETPAEPSTAMLNYSRSITILSDSSSNIAHPQRNGSQFSAPPICARRDSPVLILDPDGSGYSSENNGGNGDDHHDNHHVDGTDYDDANVEETLRFRHPNFSDDVRLGRSIEGEEDIRSGLDPIAPETIVEESGEDDGVDSDDGLSHVTTRRRPGLAINLTSGHGGHNVRLMPPLSPVLERPTTSEVVSSETGNRTGRHPAVAVSNTQAGQSSTTDKKPTPPRPVWDFDSELRMSDEPKRYKIVSGTLTGVSGALINAEVESDRLGLLNRSVREQERSRDMTHIALLSKQAGIKTDMNRSIGSLSSPGSFGGRAAGSVKSVAGSGRSVRSGASALQPRDVRAESESLRDFSDFLRTTGPDLISQRSRPNLHSPSVDTSSISSSGNPGLQYRSQTPTIGLASTARPKNGAGAVRAGGPVSSVNADLIDFLRQGPPSGIGPSSHASLTSNSVNMRVSSINSATPLLNHSANTSHVSTGAFANADDPVAAQPRHRKINKDPYALPSEDEDENVNDEDDDDGDDDFDLTSPYRRRETQEESMFDFLNSVEPPKPTDVQPFMLSEKTKAALAERNINIREQPGGKSAKSKSKKHKSHQPSGSGRSLFGLRSKKTRLSLDTRSATSIPSPGPTRSASATQRSPSATPSAHVLGSPPSWPLRSNPTTNVDRSALEALEGSPVMDVGLGISHSKGSDELVSAVSRSRPILRPRSRDDGRSGTAELAAFLRDSGPPEPVSKPGGTDKKGLTASPSFLSDRTGSKRSWRRKLVG